MLRIRFPDHESCIAALATASDLPASNDREVLIEDLFVAFEVAGFDRRAITALGLTYCEKNQETDMARPAGTPNKATAPRRRKIAKATAFHNALRSAEALLTAREKELEEAQETARKLQLEIPNLKGTISALRIQLNPPTLPMRVVERPVAAVVANGAEGINEVKDGMGVVLSNSTEPPPQEVAPDIDAIPGMEGQWT